jgi:hypothetical protein
LFSRKKWFWSFKWWFLYRHRDGIELIFWKIWMRKPMELSFVVVCVFLYELIREIFRTFKEK